MRFDKGCEIIWKDRKRRFGLPLSFYRYYIVKKDGEWVKFFRHKGFFSAIIDDINVYRCFDVTLFASLADRIFGTGTIEISSNDAHVPSFHLRHIKNPYKVRDMISSLIEIERKKKNIGITEFQVTDH